MNKNGVVVYFVVLVVDVDVIERSSRVVDDFCSFLVVDRGV